MNGKQRLPPSVPWPAPAACLVAGLFGWKPLPLLPRGLIHHNLGILRGSLGCFVVNEQEKKHCKNRDCLPQLWHLSWDTTNHSGAACFCSLFKELRQPSSDDFDTAIPLSWVRCLKSYPSGGIATPQGSRCACPLSGWLGADSLSLPLWRFRLRVFLETEIKGLQGCK